MLGLRSGAHIFLMVCTISGSTSSRNDSSYSLHAGPPVPGGLGRSYGEDTRRGRCLLGHPER